MPVTEQRAWRGRPPIERRRTASVVAWCPLSNSPPLHSRQRPEEPNIVPPGAADRHIALIGFRGCGKSAVGACLAAILHRRFIDTDQRIEQRAGRSVRDIFQHDGEERFRELEVAAVRDALVCAGSTADSIGARCVISIGGGAVLREDTRQLLAAACTCIWLVATPAAIIARLEADPRSATLRPALTAAPLAEEVDTLLAQREPIYAALADCRIDTTCVSVEEVVARIAAWLNTQTQPGGAA